MEEGRKRIDELKLAQNRMPFFVFCFIASYFLFSILCLNAFAQGRWEPAAIHIATTVSDGNLTVEQVAGIARSKGVKIVIITDRDSMKWEYGLWPFRYLIKKTVEMNSVSKYGVDNYLKLIELESKKNKDMVILPGLEVSPFYYWSGSPIYGNLRIGDWHKHILVFGLTSPKDYKELPVLTNSSLAMKPVFRHIFFAWPVLTVLMGILFMTKREFSYKDDLGHVSNVYSLKWRVAGAVTIVLSIIFLLNNAASPFFEFHQYADFGSKPHQLLIDYVNQKGGQTFWAHPEAKNISRQGNIRIETWAHVKDLWDTKGYSGFSIFYEGYEEAGKIGGDWDYLLSEYCDGARDRPVWVIGGLAFDFGTQDDLKKALDDLQTYIYLDKRDPASVLGALRTGRVYVSRGAEKNKFLLTGFSVIDAGSGKSAGIGGQIDIKGRLSINIKGEFVPLEDTFRQAQIKLVRNGKLVKTFPFVSGAVISYEDADLPEGMSFYRLEIKNGSQLIVTNPIFVRKV